MTVKKINVFMVLLVLIQVFAPFQEAVEFNAKEVKSADCFTYSLTADKSEITEGYQVQFNFEFESVSPACSPADITGEQIIIDFSPIVDSGSDILYSFDTNIFDIDVSSSGVVTLTFKDLSSEGETLVDFGGNAVFTVTAKGVEGDQDVTITDNVGNEIIITIVDNEVTDANTNKGSFSDYVEVGDTVTYQILINNEGNHIDNFHGVDSHSPGVEYVDGSFYAQQDTVWINMDDYFTSYYDTDGNMIIDNTQPFDVPVLFTYDMLVTDQEEVYHNQFDATYNTEYPEIVGDDVWFDMGGGSWIDYTHGNIEITKVDEDGNVLAGAEFDILDSEGTVVDHVVTDSEGLATSIDLPLGDYTVVETVAPAGYILDETAYPITITDTDDDMIFELTVENELATGNIQITKVDEDGNVLAGAEFDILDSEGTVVDHVVTDSEGLATSIDLPLGDYTVVETVAPAGYILDETAYPITITDTDDDMIFELTVENELATGNIQITKVDEDGNVLAGAEFDILDSEGTVVDHVVTDSEGLATSIELSLGDYTVVETVAPAGYVLDETAYPITITDTDDDMIFELTVENELATGNIQITKVDEDGNVLAGAEFDILDSEGTIVDHVVTDSEGLATSIDLPLGDYTVVETVAPDGYSLDATPHSVTITTSGQTVELEVVNVELQTPDIELPQVTRVGNIEITKVDEDGNVLAGAEFDILDSEGTIVDHVVTDSEGLATSIDLPLGDYTVVETVAPDGYSLDATPHGVTITTSGQTVELEVVNVELQTPDIELPQVTRVGNIEITKVDEDGNVLAGAEFDILDSEGTVVDHVVTDSEGLATSIDLPLGDYTVVETVAPDGYSLDATPHSVTITTSGQTVELEVVNVELQTPDIELPQVTRVGNIQITKVDEDGNVLAGAEFDILDSEGTVVDHVVTDSEGLATSIDLPLGDYTVVETVAPDGYSLDATPHSVTITTSGQTVELEVVNVELQTPDIELPQVTRVGNIQITKVDEDGNVLAGAEFDILDSEGTVVDHVVTDSEGLATSIDLPLGDYTVVETVAPDGYSLDATPHSVTITTSGQTVELEVVNVELQTPDIELPQVTRVGNIQITKVDEDGNVLAGAEFDILDSEGTVVDHVVTDSEGLATSIDLPLGDYTVVETVAPDGYSLDATPHSVTITTSGQTVELDVVNVLIETPDILVPEIEGESEVDSEIVSEQVEENNDQDLAVTGSESVVASLFILLSILFTVRYTTSKQ